MRQLVFTHKETGQRLSLNDLDRKICNQFGISVDGDEFSEPALEVLGIFQAAVEKVQKMRGTLEMDGKDAPFTLTDAQAQFAVTQFMFDSTYSDYNAKIVDIATELASTYYIAWEYMQMDQLLMDFLSDLLDATNVD